MPKTAVSAASAASTSSCMTPCAMPPVTERLLALCKADDPLRAVLSAAVEHFPTTSRAFDPSMSDFACLAKTILFQQLHHKAAMSIWNRLVALFGADSAALQPAPLLALSEEQFRSAGVSRNKMLSLQSLADHYVKRAHVLSNLNTLADAEIAKELVAVRGIGPWTAQIFMMFRLGRLDQFPTNDLGLREALRRLHKMRERPAERDVAALAARWAPLRSVAAWYLWRSLASGTPIPGSSASAKAKKAGAKHAVAKVEDGSSAAQASEKAGGSSKPRAVKAEGDAAASAAGSGRGVKRASAPMPVKVEQDGERATSAPKRVTRSAAGRAWTRSQAVSRRSSAT